MLLPWLLIGINDWFKKVEHTVAVGNSGVNSKVIFSGYMGKTIKEDSSIKTMEHFY